MTKFEVAYVKSKVTGIAFSMIPESLKIFWVTHFNNLSEEEKWFEIKKLNK